MLINDGTNRNLELVLGVAWGSKRSKRVAADVILNDSKDVALSADITCRVRFTRSFDG